MTYAIYDEDPPCDDCEPELMAVNEDAARVFMYVHDQKRTNQLGESIQITLDLVPVFSVMDMIKVKDQNKCLDLVRHAFFECEATR